MPAQTTNGKELEYDNFSFAYSGNMAPHKVPRKLAPYSQDAFMWRATLPKRLASERCVRQVPTYSYSMKDAQCNYQQLVLFKRCRLRLSSLNEKPF